MKKMLCLVGPLVLFGAACGGDGASGSTTTLAPATTVAATTTVATTVPAAGGDDVAAVTADVLKAAGDEGITLDEACVTGVVQQLTDDDLQKLVATIGDTETDPGLSAEGEALSGQLLTCMDKSVMVDMIMQAAGDLNGLDPDCVRDLVMNMTPDQIAALGSEAADTMQLEQDMIACVTPTS